MKITSIYIHIPFCLRKCNYCDFLSVPIDENNTFRDNYINMLSKEFSLSKKKMDFSQLCTIYFGGGTPSLFQPKEIYHLLNQLPSASEITLEANPETLDKKKLFDFKEAGINRISIGVQNFQMEFLKAMGRGHTPYQAISTVENAKEVGFRNINIDLIYNLPGQTLENWYKNISQAIALDTQHISLYGLTIEENTTWDLMKKEGFLPPVNEDLGADMFEMACKVLHANGFHHYEISNFAHIGFECRHNISYWQRKNYLGIGVAAASCLLNHRIYNQKSLSIYKKMLDEGKKPLLEEEWLSIDEVMSEAIFLGLRLIDGINFSNFIQQYGISPTKRFKKEITRMENAGLLIVDGEGMRLSPRGVLLGNRVFSEFI